MAAYGDGVDEARDTEALAAALYEDLRRMAGAYFQREGSGLTLQPTALVHEVYLRMADQEAEWSGGHAHFLAIAARTMRRVLVDAGRARKAEKRGGAMHRVTLADRASDGEELSVDIVDLGEALEKLGQIRPRSLQIVELRFFAGLTFDETVEALGLSRAVVAKDWSMGRAYLSKFLGEVAAE